MEGLEMAREWGKSVLTEEEKKAREEKAEQKKQEKEEKEKEKTEREKQEQEEKKKEEQRKRECRLNKKINFYVMRHMWQVIRGRNAANRIYECFGISRQRYSRAIETGHIRCSASELDKWEQLTGISKKIFQGEDIFTWHTQDSMEEAVSAIEWKKLFAWRGYEKIEGKEVDDKEGRALQEKIHKDMKKAARYDRNTHHFFRLCYFLEKDKPAPLQESDLRLKGVQQALRTLTFSLADDCSIELLEDTLKLLNNKRTMVNGIIVYRKEKQKDN